MPELEGNNNLDLEAGEKYLKGVEESVSDLEQVNVSELVVNSLGLIKEGFLEDPDFKTGFLELGAKVEVYIPVLDRLIELNDVLRSSLPKEEREERLKEIGEVIQVAKVLGLFDLEEIKEDLKPFLEEYGEKGVPKKESWRDKIARLVRGRGRERLTPVPTENKTIKQETIEEAEAEKDPTPTISKIAEALRKKAAEAELDPEALETPALILPLKEDMKGYEEAARLERINFKVVGVEKLSPELQESTGINLVIKSTIELDGETYLRIEFSGSGNYSDVFSDSKGRKIKQDQLDEEGENLINKLYKQISTVYDKAFQLLIDQASFDPDQILTPEVKAGQSPKYNKKKYKFNGDIDGEEISFVLDRIYSYEEPYSREEMAEDYKNWQEDDWGLTFPAYLAFLPLSRARGRDILAARSYLTPEELEQFNHELEGVRIDEQIDKAVEEGLPLTDEMVKRIEERTRRNYQDHKERDQNESNPNESFAAWLAREVYIGRKGPLLQKMEKFQEAAERFLKGEELAEFKQELDNYEIEEKIKQAIDSGELLTDEMVKHIEEEDKRRYKDYLEEIKKTTEQPLSLGEWLSDYVINVDPWRKATVEAAQRFLEGEELEKFKEGLVLAEIDEWAEEGKKPEEEPEVRRASGPTQKEIDQLLNEADTPSSEPNIKPETAELLQNPAEKLEQLRKRLANNPGEAEQLVAEVKDFIRDNPDVISAHRVLGDVYMRSGKFQQAIDEYNFLLAQGRKGGNQ